MNACTCVLEGFVFSMGLVLKKEFHPAAIGVARGILCEIENNLGRTKASSPVVGIRFRYAESRSLQLPLAATSFSSCELSPGTLGIRFSRFCRHWMGIRLPYCSLF